MGLKAAILALLLAGTPLQDGARYLESRQLGNGAFAERGVRGDLSLTAWSALALRAAGKSPSAATRTYLREAEPRTPTELELTLLARAALGERAPSLLERVRALERPSGAIGPTLNSTAWGVIALRQAGERAPRRAVAYLLRHQGRSGGWSWAPGIGPDSNDTAAAVQALRAAGVRGRPITRALAFLRRHRNADGGFELARGRGSDAQSTAWAIQAFLAARARVPRGAYAYLVRLRRRDGSFRYSARYAVTPVLVTAQVLPALARKPFPLR